MDLDSLAQSLGGNVATDLDALAAALGGQFQPSLADTGQSLPAAALNSAARGFASLAPGVVGGLGVLTGSETLDAAADRMDAAINETFPVNPALADTWTVKGAGAIGNAASFMLTGGVGGAVGKGLGSIRAGAEIASLGSGFLAGTREGAGQAERLGLEGGEAYFRSILGGVTEAVSEKLLFGLGTETAAARRLLGDGTVEGRWFQPLTAAYSEAGEESFAALASNAANLAMAPAGVNPGGLLDGVGEAAALGAIAGTAMGGFNALIGPGQDQASTSTPQQPATAGPAPSTSTLPPLLRQTFNGQDFIRQNGVWMRPLSQDELANVNPTGDVIADTFAPLNAADAVEGNLAAQLEARARAQYRQAPPPSAATEAPPAPAVDISTTPAQTSTDDSTSDTFQSAIDFLNGVDAGTAGETANPGPSQRQDSTGTGARRSPERTLAQHAQTNRAVIPGQWLETLEELEGGNEHETFRDPSNPSWRIKVTNPNLSLSNGRPRIPPLTEAQYLERWQLSNLVFGDGSQWLGIIPDPQGTRIVIRQPEVEAADPANPHPSIPEINAWLRKAGFEYQSGAWMREADGVVIGDAHEGNFIKTANGIRPIDLELYQTADARSNNLPIIPWAENPANPDLISPEPGAPVGTGATNAAPPVFTGSTQPPGPSGGQETGPVSSTAPAGGPAASGQNSPTPPDANNAPATIQQSNVQNPTPPLPSEQSRGQDLPQSRQLPVVSTQPEAQAPQAGTQSSFRLDPLPDPTGADLISAMRAQRLRLGGPARGTAEWEWYEQLEREAASSPLRQQSAEAAARRGEVDDPKALLAWLHQNNIVTPGAPAANLDEVASILSGDAQSTTDDTGPAFQTFPVTATELGPSILAAIDSRVKGRAQADPLSEQEREQIARERAAQRALVTASAQSQGQERSVLSLANELAEGDVLTIGGQTWTLRDVDPDAGTATLIDDQGQAAPLDGADLLTIEAVNGQALSPSTPAAASDPSDTPFSLAPESFPQSAVPARQTIIERLKARLGTLVQTTYAPANRFADQMLKHYAARASTGHLFERDWRAPRPPIYRPGYATHKQAYDQAAEAVRQALQEAAQDIVNQPGYSLNGNATTLQNPPGRMDAAAGQRQPAQAQAPPLPSDPASRIEAVNAALRRALGLRRLPARVQILHSTAPVTLSDGSRRQWKARVSGGRIEINAANIASEAEAIWNLEHELAHEAFRSSSTSLQRAWNRLTRALAKHPDIRAEVEALRYTPDQLTEEQAVRLAQKLNSKGPWSEAWEALKEAVFNFVTGKWGDITTTFTDRISAALAARAIMADARDRLAPQTEAEMAVFLATPEAAYNLTSPFQAKAWIVKMFNERIDKWQETGDAGRDAIILGKTTPVLRAAGAEDLSITVNPSLLSKVTQNAHAVPIEALRALPQSLADPVAVFQSRSQPGSLVVLTEFNEPGKGPIIISVRLDKPAGRELTVNEVTSMYGRPASDVARMFSEQVLYENKKKSLAWARRVGLQLPKRGTPMQGNERITGPEDIVNQNDGEARYSLADEPSQGRAQPLDAPVLTPDGYRPIGSLTIGDAIASTDGAPSTVTGIYPQGRKQVFKITLADGRTVRATADHLWLSKLHRHPTGSVRDTQTLKRQLSQGHRVEIPALPG